MSPHTRLVTAVLQAHDLVAAVDAPFLYHTP
jgi:hypothetical protein